MWRPSLLPTPLPTWVTGRGPEAARREDRPHSQWGPRAELQGPVDADVGGAAQAACEMRDRGDQALDRRDK